VYWFFPTGDKIAKKERTGERKQVSHDSAKTDSKEVEEKCKGDLGGKKI